eukprot:365994-Chlamydomonas_euryale.AAC.10
MPSQRDGDRTGPRLNVLRIESCCLSLADCSCGGTQHMMDFAMTFRNWNAFPFLLFFIVPFNYLPVCPWRAIHPYFAMASLSASWRGATSHLCLAYSISARHWAREGGCATAVDSTVNTVTTEHYAHPAVRVAE